MSVSSLAQATILSPNHYDGRAYEITRITPHHTACVATAEQIAGMFQSTARQASCNYAIGYDGSIVCVVDEANASWCSSSWDNDNRAITVEVSDCDYDWNISTEAQEAYIRLCVDLIQRYPSLGGSYRWTGDLSGNVTLHRWFASTQCPAQHMIDLQPYLVDEINRRLDGGGRYGVPMECILHPDESGTLFYVCGTSITHLDAPDNQRAVEQLAEACGVDMPYVKLGTKAAPWGYRFFEACNQVPLYNKWVNGIEDVQEQARPAQGVDTRVLAEIGDAFVKLGDALKEI